MGAGAIAARRVRSPPRAEHASGDRVPYHPVSGPHPVGCGLLGVSRAKDRMKIVVGLGNPGKQYEETRHNVGWMVLDRIAERAGWSGRVKARDASAVVFGRHRGLDLLLAKPTTYMNESGIAVRKLLARERAPLEDLFVVVDDFALPFGRLRIRESGSAGSHNGLRSIIGEMGSERFARVRIGIGAPQHGKAIGHVLARFTADERRRMDEVLEAAADAVEDWARDGASKAANRWNTWLPSWDREPEESKGKSASAAPAPAEPSVERAPGAESAAATPPAELPAAEPRPRESAAVDRGRGAHRRRQGGTRPMPRAVSADDGDDGQRDDDKGAQPIDGRSAPDKDGIVRTRTGWRRLLPGGSQPIDAEPEPERRR